jgi:signal transduction histidine kinase
MLALAAAAVWAGWQRRLRRIRRQFSIVLAERARLSREIHDTLLQSLVGVALQFDAIASDRESLSSSTRDQLVRMRKLVEERIRETRQSILGLRSPTLERLDLPTALCEAGHNAVGGAPTAFDFAVAGTPAPISRRVEEQLLRIGEEAVLNACRHADADGIRMTLEYASSVVTLTVADDGKGFDPAAVSANGNGHYGLVSMRERAEDVGGRLDVRSGGAGTEVVATLPLPGHSRRDE